MSTLDPPAHAHVPAQLAARRVDATARALVRSWRLTVLGTTCFVGVWVALMALAVVVDDLLYLPVLAMMAVASAYNVRRFVPRASDERPSGVALASRDAAEVRTRLRAHTEVDVPEQIHLTADPFVRIGDDGVLRIGLPVALCLDAADVSTLVEDATLAHTLASRPPAAGARRIAEGRLGRGLRDGPERASRRLLAGLDARADAFYEALDESVQAVREERSAAWAPTLVRHGLVVEAWWLVLQRWVVPALEERHLPVRAFSGARDLLAAATELRLTDVPVVAATPLLPAHRAEAYEEAVARTLSARPDGLQEVTWVDHAPAVLLPMWRRTVARGLVAVARAVGEPRPATLGTLIEVLEQGWGETIAASLADPLGAPDDVSGVIPDLLAAATWLAGLEAPGARLSWSWPFGPMLDTPDRDGLDAGAAAAAALGELARTGGMSGYRHLLREHGVDLDTPMWLDEGAGPEADRVIASVVAHTGWRKNVVLVLSEQALRVFEDSYVESVRRDVRLRMVGPHETLEPLMSAVEDGAAGDPTVEVQVRDVVHAELASVLGGIYWRLRVWTVDGTTRIHAAGDPGLVEQVLEHLLQDRLRTRWTHLPTRLRTARFWFTSIVLGLGNLLVLTGPIGWVTGDASAPDALATSALGLGVLLLVLLPGAVLSGVAARRAARATGHLRPAPRHAGARRRTGAG
ncbi:hypothetical protein [Nocardioides sp.]|uniref:hypothetical protein n=1 Tax=Nocardioides sp. TaxID=35761 RepID=UPI00261F0E73|nr:hypothetical protein [Nocardioides sp.]MCW2738575.1 Cell wall surface anchor family protein [Nocardioides sp.]